jgi:hypothetical protein
MRGTLTAADLNELLGGVRRNPDGSDYPSRMFMREWAETFRGVTDTKDEEGGLRPAAM